MTTELNYSYYTSNQLACKSDTNKILADLGRATRRGIKKCPNCGFLNGTRGYMCKNSSCNTILKDSEKRKIQLDTIKLETGTNRQIYSVQVRDKGPDSRGFVQLPYYENEEKNILSEDALCFVDTCRRLFDNSILKCHENDTVNISTICIHIESALKSINVANPLEFKHDLINNLNVEDDIKKNLCMLAKSTNGPVVQKVYKSIMAVKCQVTATNPLGYLHITLSSSKGDGNDEMDQFYCACSDTQVKTSIEAKPERKCLHYYALVCAFASDTKFLNKYILFVNAEFDPIIFSNYDYNLVLEMINNEISQDTIINDVPIYKKDSILEFENPDAQNGLPAIQIEVLPSNYDIFDPDKIDEDMMNIPYSFLGTNTKVKSSKKRKLKKEKCIELKKKVLKKNSMSKNDMTSYFDVLSFNEWLPSVTEQINESMFYECQCTEPLIFHIPNKFFELLRDRICFGTTKMRLPNTTTTIIRKTPPLGTFFKSSWRITNIFHLKQMFDTNKVPLKVTKHFIQNSKGDFVEYKYVPEENTYTKNQVPIRPSQFVTYLKVGNTEIDQQEPTPFIIEWTPDLFKVSKFGELRLVLQFGHKVIKNV